MSQLDPNDPCVFCEIVAGRAPALLYDATAHSIIIEPLGPVTPGHALVIPRVHIEDAAVDPEVTGQTFADAAAYASRMRRDQIVYRRDPAKGPEGLTAVIARIDDFNLITSAGREATQTVDHLHVHVVPRRMDDGLSLPWTKASKVQITSRLNEPTEAKVWRDGVLVFDGVDRSVLPGRTKHVHDWMAPAVVSDPELECACGAFAYRRRNGEIIVIREADGTAVVPEVDNRPHSRACGPFCRGHGTACSKNCPTCGGMDIKRRFPDIDAPHMTASHD